MTDPQAVLEAVIRHVDAGRRAALCAIVATRGSTPQPAGTAVAVDEAMQMVGTLGGGCVENEMRRKALQLLACGHSALLTFELDHDFGHDDGMICGGSMDVAVNVITSPHQLPRLRDAARRIGRGETAVIPLCVASSDGVVEYRLHLDATPKAVIAGGGHIARVLAELLVLLGFRVTVIDERASFANARRFPPPMEPVVGDIAQTLGRWPLDAGTFVVILTRGHRHDEQALAAVLDRPSRYVGMIGSRRKIEIVFAGLRQAGARPELLERVRAPIGLDIHARTAEEIALSIAAELVSVRRCGQCERIEGPLPVMDGST